jgi:hypothetical protein
MRVSFPDKAFVKKLRIPQKFQISPVGEKLAGYFHGQIQEVFMEIQCDECGAVAESVMPESAKDGDIEHPEDDIHRTCIGSAGGFALPAYFLFFSG